MYVRQLEDCVLCDVEPRQQNRWASSVQELMPKICVALSPIPSVVGGERLRCSRGCLDQVKARCDLNRCFDGSINWTLLREHFVNSFDGRAS
jgi:hypothetical protein